MTKLMIETPISSFSMASNIDIDEAAQLVIAYVHKHDVHYDLDAVFTDENGVDHQFDFETEKFN